MVEIQKMDDHAGGRNCYLVCRLRIFGVLWRNVSRIISDFQKQAKYIDHVFLDQFIYRGALWRVARAFDRRSQSVCFGFCSGSAGLGTSGGFLHSYFSSDASANRSSVE